jgi:tetratricopeptide (TPR) repeat protein
MQEAERLLRHLWSATFPALAVFCLFCTAALASDFDAANQLYDQGKFAEAKQHYEKLVESGEGSANVFYDLGNTDYRLGSTGRAILNYERALALNPRHPEAHANLHLLRQQAGARLRSVSRIERVVAMQPGGFWTVSAAVAGWVMLFGFAFIWTSRREEKSGLWLLALAGALVFAGSLTALWIGARDQALAIITARQTEARLAPAESAGVAEALPAGSRVRVLSERGEWVYCELPGAGRGWIPQKAVERVRPVPS